MSSFSSGLAGALVGGVPGAVIGGSLGGGGNDKKPGSPPVPDFNAAIQAQSEANQKAARQSAQLSNPNVTTPYGSQTVTFNGDTPNITQTLSPEQQKLYGLQTQNQYGLGQAAQQGISGLNLNPIDPSSLPSMPINPGTTATQAMLSRIEPNIAQSREMMGSQLANQGIPLGSEAYNNAMRTQGEQENDLRLQAGAAGIPLDMQARQQALQEQMGLQSAPINNINALMSGSQAQMPQFQGYQGSQITPAPAFAGAQAQNQAENNIFNQKMGQYNNMMGGLFGLGQTGMMAATMSDRRLKKNIKQIGKWKNHNLYSYDYIWGKPSIGVMADEVEMIKPEAVTMKNGYKAVYYGML